MTLNTTQTTVVHFIADGEVKEFNFNFQIFEAGDIDVYLDETLTDIGYNVSINENIGGKVIFTQPPANGTRITIIRNLDIKRTSEFQEGGAFRAKVINHELDYQVASLQQLDEKINRTMIYPPYAQEGISTSLPLPSAGKALVWNQNATALINSSINVDEVITETYSARDVAKDCADQAFEYKTDAQLSENNAHQSAINAAQSAEEAKQYMEKSSFANIGDIQYTTRTDVPNGGAWCDGAEYTQAMFPDIYQMLVDGKLQSTSITDFDSSVSTKGYCELFGLDISKASFKVPNLPNKYIIDNFQTAPVSIKGNGKALGITDGIRNYGTFIGNDYGLWASASAYGSNINSSVSQTDSANLSFGITTDALNSGIVGTADVSGIQKAVMLKPYVVLYSSVAEFSIVDYTEQLEEKTQEGLDALSSASNALTQSDITNCITKIQQDIRLSISNKSLYTKAGDKVYIPNGFEEDGVTRKFDVFVLPDDRIGTASATVIGRKLQFINPQDVSDFPRVLVNNCYSGDTPPSGTQLMLWYDTANNLVKLTTDGGGSWSSGFSLPYAETTEISQEYEIDQVFNGFGYIGSTVFILPSVEGLIPNGRNADGSLNNKKFVIDSVKTYDMSGYVDLKRDFDLNIGYYSALQIPFTVQSTLRFTEDKAVTSESHTHSYINSENQWYDYIRANSSWVKEDVIIFAKLHLTADGKISLFVNNTVFQAVDKNNTEWASTASKPSNRYVDLTLQASGTSYTAPGNGWVIVNKPSTSPGQFVAIQRADDTLFCASWSPGTAQSVYVNAPVKKNEQFRVLYTTGGVTEVFRFYYDEGAE